MLLSKLFTCYFRTSNTNKMKNQIHFISIDQNQRGVFSNTLNLAGWLNNLAWDGLNNLGVACVLDRKAGEPEVTKEERAWMFQLILESVRKKHYQIMNETFDFIPDRVKNAKMFKTIQPYY